MGAPFNQQGEPVTVQELIAFYTELLNGISASDSELVQAFRDMGNLTMEQRDAFLHWLNVREAIIRDVVEIAMARHVFGTDIRN